MSKTVVTYEYRSDYDILVIVKSVKIANSYDLWRKVKRAAGLTAMLQINRGTISSSRHININHRLK